MIPVQRLITSFEQSEQLSLLFHFSKHHPVSASSLPDRARSAQSLGRQTGFTLGVIA
jgi:hypothetical protein